MSETTLSLEAIKDLLKALENCRSLDTSPPPNYNQEIRGHKPGLGQRFKTPREIADRALRNFKSIYPVLPR